MKYVKSMLMMSVFLLLQSGCEVASVSDEGQHSPIVEEALRADLSSTALAGNADVIVPAGSKDALAAAIADAGPGGTVLLKAGLHKESGTVEINHAVTLVGESGAKLISQTVTLGTTGITDPALFIHNAANVVVKNIIFLPHGEVGGTAIFTEDAPAALIADNHFKDYEYSIVIHQGDRSRVLRNTIVGSSAWLTGDLPDVEGIINLNGDFVVIDGNTVSNTLIGIFASDRKGLLSNNNTFGNFLGVILCNVPAVVPTPSGEIVGSETNATRWILRNNKSHDNFDIGYLVIDGANQNYLVNNEGGNNGRYDIEIAGESERFGFFTPTSRETTVDTGKYPDLTVKVCGVDDTVIGGQLVDTVVDPCN